MVKLYSIFSRQWYECQIIKTIENVKIKSGADEKHPKGYTSKWQTLIGCKRKVIEKV